jgi:hypothetical protein
MSLELTLPYENPPTGLGGSAVKPITEGTRATAVADQQSTGLFSFLDDLRTTAQNGAKDILGAVAQREVDRIRTGAESRITSEGDPQSNPQNVDPGKDPQPFYRRYKTELMIGGAIVGGLMFILIASRD